MLTRNSSQSKKSKELWKRTSKVIPCGVQTLSKAPNKFIDGLYPKYIESGSGCYLFDSEGNKYIDYPLGLGAILLGYSYPEINDVIKKQCDNGIIFTLPSILETILAEKICEIVPSAETCRFLKTGSEAVSAAVKIARSFTRKNKVFYCGYHGWHDWYTVNTPKNKGIPKSYKEYTHKFEFNNIESLRWLFVNKGDVAAVVLEPYIYEEPKDNFLSDVIELAHKNGAVVIFDEVVTGFRTQRYTAQAYYDAIPDLTCLGKAMANGMPISVVCGKKKLMSELEGDCFVSSTFGGELLSIVSALETINILENDRAIDSIWESGMFLRDGYNEIATSMDLDTECIGLPCRTMFMFPSGVHKSLFWQECIKRGVLFGYAQFISYSHKIPEIEYTLSVVKEALEVVKKNWSNPEKALEGKAAEEVFRLVATR